MARDLNNVSLIGNLVRDPEMKYTQSGMAVCKISIANNFQQKKNNEYVDDVNYFDISVFGSVAENCGKYLKKGSKIGVSGELRQNRWTDNQSGQNRSKVEIISNQIQFLNTKNN
jgi:single-strand DNA-binding protein